jgi:hypothetical protein
MMRALTPHDRTSLPVLALLTPLADQDFPAENGDARQRWAEAIDLLLLHGPRDGISARWEQVLASAEATSAWAQAADGTDPGFSLLAHSPVMYWPAAYRHLTPQQVTRLYERLAQHGHIDDPANTATIFGPGRRGIHSRLPELLAQHLTQAAANELQNLTRNHPSWSDLAADHARRLSENLPPLSLADFSTMTSDASRRIVRDTAELAQVVLESLDTLQEQVRCPEHSGQSIL